MKSLMHILKELLLPIDMRSHAVVAPVLAGAAIAVIAGCSVETPKVVNHPPVINKGVITYDVEYGTLKPESVSLFYWPQGLDEAGVEKVVRDVKGAANQFDVSIVKLSELRKLRLKLETEFAAASCIETWADLGVDEDPELIDWVMKWKPIPENATDEQAKGRAACITNQDSRKAMAQEMDAITSKQQPELLRKILTTLDADPRKPENMKSVGAKGSEIVIKLDEASNRGVVDVTFKDFIRPGNTQSTKMILPADASDELKQKAASKLIVGAAYDPSRKLLRFAVPELDEDGEPTGAMLHFLLERNPNFLGMARFAGDVKLVKDGVVLRYGSAKIDGALTAF